MYGEGPSLTIMSNLRFSVKETPTCEDFSITLEHNLSCEKKANQLKRQCAMFLSSTHTLSL